MKPCINKLIQGPFGGLIQAETYGVIVVLPLTVLPLSVTTPLSLRVRLPFMVLSVTTTDPLPANLTWPFTTLFSNFIVPPQSLTRILPFTVLSLIRTVPLGDMMLPFMVLPPITMS